MPWMQPLIRRLSVLVARPQHAALRRRAESHQQPYAAVRSVQQHQEQHADAERLAPGKQAARAHGEAVIRRKGGAVMQR